MLNMYSIPTYFFFLILCTFACTDAVWLPFKKHAEPNDTPLVVLKKKDEKRTIRTMSFEELEDQKDIRLASGNVEMAIKYLQAMMPLCDDLQKLNMIILEVADLLFERDELKQAEAYYREFCTLYPGDEKIEYALYKAILCSFNMILIPDRDQSKTHKTLELVDSFLNRQVIFTSYLEKVLEIKHACLIRLLDSEMSIARNYLKQNKYVAVQQRIAYMRLNYLDTIPEFKDMVDQLENTLVVQRG
jgi:outer membrane assembly lipoprotein YfiO